MILADGHVHFHACFDLERFLDAAADNFRAHEQSASPGVHCEWMLWLSESSDAELFDRLRDRAGGSHRLPPRGWSFEITSEDCAIRCRNAGKGEVTLVAGRQIVTGEGVEVLALGTTIRIRDGMSFDETLHRVRESDALPVLPWGFGKWLGGRGSIVNRQLELGRAGALFLGDNGGRPAFGSTPREFSKARAAGIKILPGSDPLPLATEYRKVAGYGFSLAAARDRLALVSQAKELLRDPNTPVKPFGQLEKPWQFLRNQLAMRIIKRRPRTALLD